MLLNYRQQIKTPSSVFTAFEMDREGLRGFTPSFSFFFFLQQKFCLQNKEKSSLHLNPGSSSSVSNLAGDSSGSTPKVKRIW